MGSYDTINFSEKTNKLINDTLRSGKLPWTSDYQTKDLGRQLYSYDIAEDLTTFNGKRRIEDGCYEITGSAMDFSTEKPKYEIGKLFMTVESGKVRYVGSGLDWSGEYSSEAIIMEFDSPDRISVYKPTDCEFHRIAQILTGNEDE